MLPSSRLLALVACALATASPASAQAPLFQMRPATVAARSVAPGPTELAIDDGSSESTISTPNYDQFVWMNVLTPPAGLCPYRVERVRVLWPEFFIQVGQVADVYLYTDSDGDHLPATGATFHTSLKSVPVQFNDGVTFSEYVLPTPLEVTGCDDLIVALVNRGMTGDDEAPATLDEGAPQGRSWVGLYGSPPPDPPTFPAPIFGRVGDLAPTNGNFIIRAVVLPVTISTEPGPTRTFELGSIVPNPARDAVSVGFTLAQPEHVRLTLYDVLGREVAVATAHDYGVGEHQATFDVTHLPSGPYVLRLLVGGVVETGRLTVQH